MRGPKLVVKRGKTPVLSSDEARALLDSVDVSTPIGLRDRALIGVMVFSFARISAVIQMNIEDYFRQSKRTWFRLHEKGGKRHDVPAHKLAREYVEAYIKVLGKTPKKTPLFQSFTRSGVLTGKRMHRTDALRMIKRRAKQVGLPPEISCHTFRATGITEFLRAGGTIENAQAIAAHESPRTTKLYDRTGDELSLDEIERILI